MRNVYVILCYMKGSTEPDDISVFESGDEAYACQKDYQLHSDYNRVIVYKPLIYPLTKV